MMLRALCASLLAGVALVAVVVDVPLLARLVSGADETGAALVLVRFLVAVPVGALAGGWAVRRLGDGPVASSGLALAAAALVAMSTWGPGSLEHWSATVVLAAAGLGVGLALAPVNDAALAASSEESHGAASALVVVARMVGMVVGLALLTAVGLHRYYAAVGALPDPTDATALRDAAVVQVATVFRGAAIAAALGALVALTLGRRRTGGPAGLPTVASEA
jgi:MFS transporter, DHA2 family, triacylglyceride efflux pump